MVGRRRPRRAHAAENGRGAGRSRPSRPRRRRAHQVAGLVEPLRVLGARHEPLGRDDELAVGERLLQLLVGVREAARVDVVRAGGAVGPGEVAAQRLDHVAQRRLLLDQLLAHVDAHVLEDLRAAARRRRRRDLVRLGIFGVWVYKQN